MLAKHTERLHTKTRDAVIYVSANINFERLMSTLLCPGRLVMRFVQMYNINKMKSQACRLQASKRKLTWFSSCWWLCWQKKEKKQCTPPPHPTPPTLPSECCPFIVTKCLLLLLWTEQGVEKQHKMQLWAGLDRYLDLSFEIKTQSPNLYSLWQCFVAAQSTRPFFFIQKAEESKTLKVISLHFWLWTEKVKFNESLHKLITLLFVKV